MNNSNYNSLAQQLAQNGIIFQEDENNSSSVNFFENSIEINNEIEKNDELKEKTNHKRINQYDMDLINSSNPIKKRNQNAFEVFKRFLNIKQKNLEVGAQNFENIFEFLFCKFCPRIYKAKLIKEAMQKLLELNIDTKTLLDKTIPYGENELRYGELVKYIKYANEIQIRLK